jgi:hypothetical protein
MFFRSLEGATNAVAQRNVYHDGVHYTCNFSYKMEDKLKMNNSPGDQAFNNNNNNNNNNPSHHYNDGQYGGRRNNNGNSRRNYNYATNHRNYGDVDGNYPETGKTSMNNASYRNTGTSSPAPPALPYLVPMNMMSPYMSGSQPHPPSSMPNSMSLVYSPNMTSSANMYYSSQQQITDYHPQHMDGMQYTAQHNGTNVQNLQHRPSPPPLTFTSSFPIPHPPSQLFYQGNSYPPSLHHAITYPQQQLQGQNPSVASPHHHQLYTTTSFSSSSPQGGYAPHYPPSSAPTYSASSGQTTGYPVAQLNYGSNAVPYPHYQPQPGLPPTSTVIYPSLPSISSSSSLTSPRSLNGNSTHSNHSNYSNTSKK